MMEARRHNGRAFPAVPAGRIPGFPVKLRWDPVDNHIFCIATRTCPPDNVPGTCSPDYRFFGFLSHCSFFLDMPKSPETRVIAVSGGPSSVRVKMVFMGGEKSPFRLNQKPNAIVCMPKTDFIIYIGYSGIYY